jgi:hypothetical protein
MNIKQFSTNVKGDNHNQLMRGITIILCVFLSLNTNAQTINENELVRVSNYQSPVPAKFRLYPTTNRFTFLRLNTSTGFIDVVQYSTSDAANTMIYGLSKFALVLDGPVDRFTLYPTQNIWTFLLLDQVEGRTYQVQWSVEPEKRLVMQIYPEK